jgi:hypothetical protein
MIKWSKGVDVELVMTKFNYCCGAFNAWCDEQDTYSYCQAN